MCRKSLCSLCLALVAIIGVGGVAAQSASAQSFSTIPKTYKVQVEYWFWDSDYYYWSTVLETDSQTDAQFVYGLLLWAHEAGQLNEIAPHDYWRYIAVDVRLVSSFNLPTTVQRNTFANPQYQLRE